MGKFLSTVLVSIMISWLGLELVLRFGSPLFPETLATLLQEDMQFDSASALRVAKGTTIVLDKSALMLPYDVVLTGDSMVFGYSLTESQTINAQLSKLFGLSVLNLATSSASGCDYDQMVHFLLKHKIKAETLIYSIFVNDFMVDDCSTHKKQFFIWKEDFDQNLRLQLRWYREWAFQKSLLYPLAKRLLSTRRLGTHPGYQPYSFQNQYFHFLFATPEVSLMMTDTGTTAVQHGIADLVAKAVETQRKLSARGIAFKVFLMPFKEQIYLPLLAQQGVVPNSLYSPLYDQSYDELKGLLESHQVVVIDPRDSLRHLAQQGEKLYWTLDGHLNPLGAQRVAELIHQQLPSTVNP